MLPRTKGQQLVLSHLSCPPAIVPSLAAEPLALFAVTSACSRGSHPCHIWAIWGSVQRACLLDLVVRCRMLGAPAGHWREPERLRTMRAIVPCRPPHEQECAAWASMRLTIA